MCQGRIFVRCVFLMVIIVGLCQWMACTEDQPLVIEEEPIGSIVGIVKPIGVIAQVIVYQGFPVDTTTSDTLTGYFELKNLNVGFYTLEVTAPHYGRYVAHGIEVVTAGTTAVGDIHLRPFPEQIEAIVPARNSENVRLDVPCGFVFTTLMDHTSVEDHFHISPSVDGYFVWEETGTQSACYYYPLTKYQTSTTYQFSLSTEAQTIYGDTLAFQVKSDFTTEPVRVLTYTPQSGASYVDPGTSIYIKFNTAMNKPSVEEAFRMVEPVIGRMTWHSEDAFSFQPQIYLATNQQYVVSITTNAKDMFGHSLAKLFTFSFTTEPLRVSYHYPANGASNISTDANIQIMFNTSVSRTEAENAFSIFPQVSGNFQWTDQTKYTFVPTEPFKSNTTYFVTISSTCQDLYGNAMPLEYTFNFTTVID